MLQASARTITGLSCSAHHHVARQTALSIQLTPATEIPSCQRLCSSATNTLLVRPTRLITVSDRALPVAAAKLWNDIPGDVTKRSRDISTQLFVIS